MGHATTPTPFILINGKVRIFVSCRDLDGRSRPFSFDVQLSENPSVIRSGKQPLLHLGAPGTFDQDGLICTSVVETEDGATLMYYAGFEKLKSIRYRIMVGLAISKDRGKSFERVSQAPILDRAPGELFIRGGPFVRITKQGYEMIYAGGSSWRKVGGREQPVYDLRRVLSEDGIKWNSVSQIIIPTDNRNFAFGRPWIYTSSRKQTTMFVSVRDSHSKSYRMAIARFSKDWDLNSLDYGIGLDPDGRGSESIQTTFAATIRVAGTTWCFYNGNDFGQDGVLLAELVSP